MESNIIKSRVYYLITIACLLYLVNLAMIAYAHPNLYTGETYAVHD